MENNSRIEIFRHVLVCSNVLFLFFLCCALSPSISGDRVVVGVPPLNCSGNGWRARCSSIMYVVHDTF